MWSDGSTTNKTVQWSIGRASIAKVPAQSGALKYDGDPKTPVWDANYDPSKMTVSVEAKVNAGTGYTAAFTPDSNHQWWDGTVDAKTATWAIGQGRSGRICKSDKCDAEYRAPEAPSLP